MKIILDGYVIGALIQCVLKPLHLIFNAPLGSPGAFVAGAIIVATLLFGEFYFRDV